jgi:hypothetical protein
MNQLFEEVFISIKNRIESSAWEFIADPRHRRRHGYHHHRHDCRRHPH